MDRTIKNIIKQALGEDVGSGDITTGAIIPTDTTAKGVFIVKEPGIIAGLEIAEEVFKQVDENIRFDRFFEEGSAVNKGDKVAAVLGKAQSLLIAERTALNFLQRMSGIATATRAYVNAVLHTKAKILDTRKTAPGLRFLDKMAVKIGGAENHRMGLYDMFLIKDNHIAVAGSLTEAVKACQRYRQQKSADWRIEVETDTLSQVEEAIHCNVDMIMLDNFSLEDIKKAVSVINGRCKIEASGGVSLENVKAIAKTGVDYISVGALTHSVKALDISFDIVL